MEWRNVTKDFGMRGHYGFLIDFMPVNSGFWPFLGDIGHFWRPDFGRKLGMDNQLQIYKNQACLRPWRIVRVELC
jgi:hypothetical protein